MNTAIVIGITVIAYLLVSVFASLFSRQKDDEVDTRLQHLEAVVDGVDSFDIDALKAEVIAKVIEATDNNPRCPECTCLRPENAKFCRSCGHQFNERQEGLRARIDDWLEITRYNASGYRDNSLYRLCWTCLDCETQNTEDFTENYLYNGRRFIHHLACAECDENMAEVIINTTEGYENVKVVESLGEFGTLSLNGKKGKNDKSKS